MLIERQVAWDRGGCEGPKQEDEDQKKEENDEEGITRVFSILFLFVYV